MDGVDDENIRMAVFAAFAETGRAPTVRELAVGFATSVARVADALRRLALARHLVLDSSRAAEPAVVMAHPFSAVPLGYRGDGPADVVVGRLCMGLVRLAEPPSGRA
jgi:hypothetical protein